MYSSKEAREYHGRMREWECINESQLNYPIEHGVALAVCVVYSLSFNTITLHDVELQSVRLVVSV